MTSSCMRRTRRANAGLSAIEILIIIVCICAVILFVGLVAPFSGRGIPSRRLSCMSNLKQLGTAMNIYLMKFGDDSYFAEPADAFRGDEFVVTLFWTNIVMEPKLFRCPATSDAGPVDASGNPVLVPMIWNRAGSLTDEQCSYAGRCKGLTGMYAHRNTLHAFTESLMGSASAMACDKADNHSRGVNVVYFDSHVTFIPDAGPDVGALHTTSGEPGLRYMDDGEW